ncbi:MAG: histidine--tRNA ligase [Planctomycetes bacterium]|nr:histidine--tRNA ligase [Planctomycetota bacterium]
MIKPRTMPGTMELLPRQQVVHQRFLDTIRQGFERFGFQQIETPAIEMRDVLLTKSGGDTEKQVYFVQSTGSLAQGQDPKLALRFDLTVPLARYVAQHEHELAFPFRRYQIQRVYRGESAQRGRFREFYQCDIDVVGKDSLGLTADAEIPAVIAHVFTALGIGSFTIHVSNRKILRGLLAAHGIDSEEQRAAILREVDKLDKRGRGRVEETLRTGDFGLDDAALAVLMDTIALRGDRAATTEKLRELDVEDPTFREGLDELDAVLGALDDLGVDPERFCANLAIARGLDYYTGTVYETLLDDHPEVGSVCSGGRYEDLASFYTKSKLPGVGISIGLTRLFDQLSALGVLDENAHGSTRVLVTEMDASLAEHGRRCASMLRAAGINTELHTEGQKLAKQFKYATKAGIRYAVILGENEVENGTAMLKDLDAGSQQEVALDELAATIDAAD